MGPEKTFFSEISQDSFFKKKKKTLMTFSFPPEMYLGTVPAGWLGASTVGYYLGTAVVE